MSFNRLNYDNCQYKQVLSESVGPGHYMVNTPPVSCEPCFPISPYTRIQTSGASIDATKHLVDINSELLNITRQESKCPSKQWVAKCPSCKSTIGYPCGQGVSITCEKCQANGGRCPDGFSNGQKPMKDCNIHTEETRTSNPPCNLRGTGWNRWEWLCLDPQDRVEIPFDWNISNRLIVKDNHRPCVPKPISVEQSLPPQRNTQCGQTTGVCSNPTNPSSVQWQKQSVINQY
jgi:hypothetical protein